MTKTTNYEISKKLQEIGFKAETSFFYRNFNNSYELFNALDKRKEWRKGVPAFTLETILDALPGSFQDGDNFYLSMSKSLIGYYDDDGDQYWYSQQNYAECNKMQNECLADNAARLLIKLHQENLIKFNQE